MAATAETVAENPLRGLVDLENYPIDQLDSETGQAVIRQCRNQLADDGCVVLKNFVPRQATERLEQETERLSPYAHYNECETNPYNSDGDDSLPAAHPKNRFDDRTNGFVASDCIGDDTIIRKIYRNPDFQRFIAAVVDVKEIHEYADPLAGLVVNVLRDGCQHPWHFDTNEFIVTMLTRKPEQGGTFEYAPSIRNTESENFEGVQQILDGDRSQLKSLDLEIGDLQIFFGRYSLHRVTPARGDKERHSVIFAYAKEPGFVGRPERAKRIFGRMAPIHERMLAEQTQHNDGLAD